MRITKKIKEAQLKILAETYKDAKPALIFKNPFELLIAVILSAQCTDKRVNVVTARLFQKAATAAKMASLPLNEIEELIKDCGLFRAKAKNILATCQILTETYGGAVPDDFDALVKLPGVGRKTANVVLSVAFNKPAIAVDTHVFRVANRLKLAAGETPEAVEEGLKKAVPQSDWGKAHHWLIYHGRQICRARNPLCGGCPLSAVCPSKN